MAEFRPIGIANAFFQGQDQAHQNTLADQAAQQNQMQMEQSQQNQSMRQTAFSDEQKKQAATMIYQAAQYALQSDRPKAFIEANYPQLVQLAGPSWASADDNAVKAKMQEALGIYGPAAGIGPAAKPVQYQQKQGPRGSILQVNPETNEQRQLIGPDNSQPSGATQKYRPLTAQEIESYGLPKGTTAQVDTATGKIDLINKPSAASVGRPLPPAIVKGLVENNSSLRKIDAALAALTKYPDAFGAKNYLGDTIRQRSDPQGVDPRAKVADIGSMLIHDRSGAAVSASEFPRLAPFIPQSTDDPATVKTKLENLKANIQMMQEETQQTFSPEQGYKEFNAAPGGAPKAAAPSQAGADIDALLNKYAPQ